MDKEVRELLYDIHKKIDNIEKDISELKSFKNRVLGGLAVFVFIVQLMGNYIFGGPR